MHYVRSVSGKEQEAVQEEVDQQWRVWQEGQQGPEAGFELLNVKKEKLKNLQVALPLTGCQVNRTSKNRKILPKKTLITSTFKVITKKRNTQYTSRITNCPNSVLVLIKTRKNSKKSGFENR